MPTGLWCNHFIVLALGWVWLGLMQVALLIAFQLYYTAAWCRMTRNRGRLQPEGSGALKPAKELFWQIFHKLHNCSGFDWLLVAVPCPLMGTQEVVGVLTSSALVALVTDATWKLLVQLKHSTYLQVPVAKCNTGITLLWQKLNLLAQLVALMLTIWNFHGSLVYRHDIR